MGEAIAFYTLAAFILGFAVLVITARNTVHSVVFLVVNFLFVAALYVTLGAQFLAVIQVLVYAGGIVVLYLFVIMLVTLKRSPEAHQDPRRLSRLGLAIGGAVLAEFVLIALYGYTRPVTVDHARPTERLIMQNVEEIGWILYTDYLIPFEVASILLLVAMMGAILLAKREGVFRAGTPGPDAGASVERQGPPART
jgi:NADH-quinone oxidoreductase subunit J